MFQKIIPPAFLFVLLLTCPDISHADLYQYETPDGDIILTTEPRNDLKLILKIETHTPNNPPPISNNIPSNNAPKSPSAMFDDYIAQASARYGIPASFIKAVIKVESNFNPRALSHAGARGLMQLMPPTAAAMKVTDPFDPKQNIMGGTKYLRQLSDRYDGDINLILASYHAGPSKVESVEGIPTTQTQQYIIKVYQWYLKYRQGTEW